MKILNLYANIGGNRKLWGDEHEITAVELNPKIAAIYQDLWPNDKVIVSDAHQYLLEHFKEFDFIWSSPPCPTHSRLVTAKSGWGIYEYPDMRLYEEIIFLRAFFKGKYCVENVISFYEPLIPPTQFASHYFWTNFYFPTNGMQTYNREIGSGKKGVPIKEMQEKRGFDLSKYKGIDKRLALRDCTEPELGKHILDWAMKDEHASLFA